MKRSSLLRVSLLALSSCTSGALHQADPTADAVTVHQRCYGYSYGEEGLPQDYAQAHHWCRRSAELGIPSGQTLYAELFYKGHGVKRDYVTAEHWYRLGAEAGHPHAQIMMGVLYLEGRGVERDGPTGILWIRRAADQGDADAQQILHRLENGREAN